MTTYMKCKNMPSLKFVFFIFWVAAQCLLSTTSQDASECLPRCWDQAVNKTKLNNGIYQKNVTNAANCKELCHNEENCIGAYWGYNLSLSSYECWFAKSSPSFITGPMYINSSYWSRANCTGDCLSYCWKEKNITIQWKSGTERIGTSSEAECKLNCSRQPNCQGVDWNDTASRCWIKLDGTDDNPFKSYLNHWTIIQNLSSNCDNASTVNLTMSITVQEPDESAANVTEATPTQGLCTDSGFSTVSVFYNATVITSPLLGIAILIIIGLSIILCRAKAKEASCAENDKTCNESKIDEEISKTCPIDQMLDSLCVANVKVTISAEEEIDETKIDEDIFSTYEDLVLCKENCFEEPAEYTAMRPDSFHDDDNIYYNE